MLPEHVKLLREWAKEDGHEKMKTLDEQQLEMMDEIVFQAMELNKELIFTYYENNHYETVKGRIKKRDEGERKLHIADCSGNVRAIPLSAIAEIKPATE